MSALAAACLTVGASTIHTSWSRGSRAGDGTLRVGRAAERTSFNPNVASVDEYAFAIGQNVRRLTEDARFNLVRRPRSGAPTQATASVAGRRR